MNTFTNEPLLDFSLEENRNAFQDALQGILSKISESPLLANPIIDGREISSDLTFNSVDPSQPSRIVGKITFARKNHVQDAIRTLQQGQKQWASTPAYDRSQIIAKVGDILRQRKMELAALIVLESGKPWGEADGDVCEAIDFCHYYATEMEKLDKPLVTETLPGEENIRVYSPKGFAAVIAPWNFPLAIACGMTVAALVTGNVTILKPSEQTSLIACELAKILLEAGVPKNAFAFLPGYGEEIGRSLVAAPEINLICFTGSKAVGMEILQKSVEVSVEANDIRKVITELGGKNAIIIDEDADLDEAVKGVIQSAFGFAGQKCSACSRVIVVGTAEKKFYERLKSATADIIIGSPEQPETFLGPVIDLESQLRIQETIETAKSDCELLYQGAVPDQGYFVPPTIFQNVHPEHSIWREEIFGPVVACHNVKTFEEAIKLANNSQYALTGGVFSRSPENLQKAREEFMAGNLYINRKCTGAIVRRQPFGGFKMSGTGLKAGGPEYLKQFLVARAITENTMRRGFAPEIS